MKIRYKYDCKITFYWKQKKSTFLGLKIPGFDCTTNITIYNDDNPNDISYQAFVKKRNNVDIDVFNDINQKIINSIYNHQSRAFLGLKI
jgi:hypothetical protein